MGRALYRKYRPKSLAEVVGQEHITTTLANAIKAGRIGHAYLLTGPRGVGKTSIARILAHELNGLAYDETQNHLDIIEIDAASNRRIDEIRDLRDKVHVLPAGAKYKIYIIDEVHMLTREAFNALLKTLEEPPAHAIFILATTEAHKLPETIISRTQHFSFKPIDVVVLTKHLESIAKNEKLTIDHDALELVALHGDGSFRDSISLLDQVRSLGDHVSKADVERLLGIAPQEALEQLFAVLNSGTAGDLFKLLTELRAQGLRAGSVATQLGNHLRNLIINNADYQNHQNTHLLGELLRVSASAQPDRVLELVLLDYIFANKPSSTPQSTTPTKPTQNREPDQTAATLSVQQQSSRSVATGQKTKAPTSQAKQQVTNDKPNREQVKPSTPPDQNTTPSRPKPATKDTSKQEQSEPLPTGTFDITAWPVVLAAIKKQYNTLYGILRMAEPSTDGNTLILSCKFGFHQKQINDSKNRKIISDIITEQTGETVSIECVLNKTAKPTEQIPAKDAVSSVSDIFGGAEVLES